MSRLTEIEERWHSEFLPDEEDAAADIEYLLGVAKAAEDYLTLTTYDQDPRTWNSSLLVACEALAAALHPDPGEEAR